MTPTLMNARPMAEAFCKLLHPLAEVVLHDLQSNKIAAIYNPFSKREVGDDSYLERWDSIDENQDVIGPYEKTNYDGQTLKSITVVLKDDAQQAVGLLCVNMDISAFQQYQNMLQMFIGNNDSSSSEPYQTVFKDDLYEQINIYVQQYCRQHQLSLDKLSRPQKQALMLELKQQGAFNGKNATQYAARVLGVSRATIYNYLK